MFNYAVLTLVAACFAYMLASLGLDPAWEYLLRNPPAPPETIESIYNRLGVNPDVPLLQRTWTWLTNIFTEGSLGLTVGYQPVTAQIAIRAGVSLQLLLVGSIVGAIVGVILGVWGAVRQYRFSDRVVTILSYLVIATPTIVMAIVLMIVATNVNQALGFQLINFSGQYSPGVADSFWPQFWDRISHLILPTFVLILAAGASYSRYQRNAMLDVLGADYIRTARAKGRTRGSALVRHGVRVALIPMSTFFAYSFGTLVAGSAILELMFGWHGMGEMAIQAVRQNDINSVAGSTLFVAILILCSSTLSEVLYAALDPRVRR
ncbi:ABC transporter permease [Microbacterium ulmi]|uniref:ABC transporter permease n=1 Tax=Microbacterium ulmi TaxID=179095 RepID=UPI0031330EC4|nr:peptide/nickel transport system permease protein [Microbacterium ulmi]